MRRGILFLSASVGLMVVLEVIVLSSRPRPSTEPVVERVPEPPPEKKEAKVIVPLEAAPSPVEERKLELELLGTITECKSPSAFIKDLRSGSRGIYRIGSQLQGASIVKIVKKAVVFDVDGRRQVIGIAGSKQGAGEAGGAFVEEVSPDTMVVRAGEMKREQKEIMDDLKRVRIKPNYEGRRVNGLRVEGIPQGSVITCAGIRNNDIIKEVNDQKIDSYQKALQVLVKARKQQAIRVSLVREGATRHLSYTIND
ncbi:MAG: hypothetical protein ACM3OC_02930 [Deltaproteobacteria bacterium]